MKVKNEKYERIWDDDTEEYCMKITNLDNGNYCFKYEDGKEEWFNKDGKRHRDEDKPAVILADGTKFWYQNGELHRDNGPAVIREEMESFIVIMDHHSSMR